MLENKPTELVITIDGDGAVEIEVLNVKGSGCKAVSKPYEDLFKIEKDTLKHEYNEASAATVQKQRI